MIKKIKKPVSILLAVLMVFSLFAVVPFTASAAVGVRAADLVEITDHETELADLGIGYVMSVWGRSMTAQEAITLAQYMSAQNDGAKCAVFYEVVDDYDLFYAMSDGKTGSRTGFCYYTLNDFLPGYKVYYLPVDLNPATYTVTWKNGDTVLKTDEVEDGATPSYTGDEPTKAEDENYTYTFAGWTPAIAPVTEDVTYTAQYRATFKGITSDELYEGLVIDAGTPIKFMIIKSGEGWRRVDLSVYLDGTLVKELVTQNVSNTEPDRYYTTTKKCIVDSYELSHGDPTRHVLYLKSVYDVTWKNDDGTTLKTDNDVAFGTTPTYDGETPTKDGVTFAGWTDSHGVFYAKDAALPEVTADETYTAVFELTIGSVDEWNSFAASVKGGNTYSGIIVRMTADVGPVTTMVDGTFSGTFDGDGHTLTVNISGGSTSAATFANVKDATIQNLRLEGTVTSSGNHTAALVKSVSDTGSTCTIKNVDIYADVNCSNNYIGGFIGHAGTANTVNIENSVFSGSINKTGSGQGNFIGGFIGWSQTLTATINNCAFTGSYNNIKSFNNIGFSYNAPTKVTVSGFYSNASEVFVANVNHGTRLYVPSSSYPTSVALVKNNDGETFYSAFSDALNAWVDGSTLTLLADVTCDSMISVPANTSKILDLNGKTLTTGATNTVYGTLTIQSTVSGGNIIHTNKSQVISVQEEATLNINSGTIHGYNADRAVIGGEGGTYNLNGGKIVTSASNAFSIGSGSTLNLNGGEIECTSDSTKMGTASAVWAHGDSTINWNGTAITTNTGDGIRIKSAGNGTVNVTGGSFTATSSSLPEEGGYAIYCNSNMGTLNLEGNPSISGRGIYLTNDKVINITDELSNTNPISVTMQTPGVFTSGLSGNGDASNFANGNGTGYALTLNASGEAQIVSTYTVTWKNGETTLKKDTVVEGNAPAYTGTTPEKAEDANYTYTFSGWKNGTNTYGKDETLPAVTANVIYTATFTSSSKYTYTLDGDNATITGYNGTDQALTIPSEIDGHPVVTIGASAFRQNKTITSVVIPDTVTYVEYNAFLHCSNLTSVTLPDSLETIGDYAFGHCDELTGLVIPDSVTHIGDYAVEYCSKLTTLVIGKSVEFIGEDAFEGCTTLNNVVLPDSLKTMEEFAFYECMALEEINIPAGITNIARFTFFGCEKLEAVNFARPTSEQTLSFAANVFTKGDDYVPIGTVLRYSGEGNYALFDGDTMVAEGTELSTLANKTLTWRSAYTVTWKNGDTVLKTDENVAYGTTPTYDGAAPTKEADTFNTYEFAGWKNGETTYAPNELPAVTGDVIYTAQFTAVPKLFAGHSVSLDGDIGVNFFINPNAADIANAQTATVKFTWDGNTKEVNLKTAPMERDCYKVTCEVVAAQMTHKIKAEVIIDGKKLKKTDSISVQDYAEKLYNDPEKYDDRNKPEQLKAMAKALLNYGSEAQTVLFAALTEIPEKRADVNVGQTDYSNVTADAIQTAVNTANPGKSASNLKSVASEFDAKLYAYSLIYLSQSTLRLYFVPAEGTTMAHSDEYDGSQSNYYYYVQKTGICASELDTLQEFEINNTKFCYSALDYAKEVIRSSKMTDTQKNLAKSLFLYNQAANAYFDDAPNTGD